MTLEELIQVTKEYGASQNLIPEGEDRLTRQIRELRDTKRDLWGTMEGLCTLRNMNVLYKSPIPFQENERLMFLVGIMNDYILLVNELIQAVEGDKETRHDNGTAIRRAIS